MAVYTPITEPELRDFLAQYELGELVGFEGIAEGVSNTNYLLSCGAHGVSTGSPACPEPAQPLHGPQDDKYILTLFESATKLEDLPYFTALMEWWSKRGIVCPKPIPMRDGRMLAALAERPALLVSFVEGEGVRKISLEHMTQLGRLVAQMHVAGMGFPHVRANALSIDAWGGMALDVRGRADEIEMGLADFMRDEVNDLSEHWPQGLPGGPIHADLFPDNVFFSTAPSPLAGEGWVGGSTPYGSLLKSSNRLPLTPSHKGRGIYLSGVIDFYYACNDAWAYDLAICVNAWCFDDRHRLVPERVQALMAAYNDVRPMADEETHAFPLLLRGAALRFLLTRTRDWLAGKGDAEMTLKDPLEYVAKLKYWRQKNTL